MLCVLIFCKVENFLFCLVFFIFNFILVFSYFIKVEVKMNDMLYCIYVLIDRVGGIDVGLG